MRQPYQFGNNIVRSHGNSERALAWCSTHPAARPVIGLTPRVALLASPEIASPSRFYRGPPMNATYGCFYRQPARQPPRLQPLQPTAAAARLRPVDRVPYVRREQNWSRIFVPLSTQAESINAH